MNYLIFDTVHCVIVTMHSQNIGRDNPDMLTDISNISFPTKLKLETLVEVNYKGVIDLCVYANCEGCWAVAALEWSW